MEFTKEIEFNMSPTTNEEITITYNGFLSNSSELTIVYGFGESWNNTTELPMEKTSSGFSAQIKMLDFDTFNFCFRNSNYEWDNNANCNYISSILPCTVTPTEENIEKFDIDALIEEILEPIMIAPSPETEVETSIQIMNEPIDLGVEISNILSQITLEDASENLVEYSTLEEILSGTVIEETPIELFENETTNEIDSSVSENTKETALISIDTGFMISPRKLGKFYSFRKHLKLSLYKLFIKIPKLIFGSEEQ